MTEDLSNLHPWGCKKPDATEKFKTKHKNDSNISASIEIIKNECYQNYTYINFLKYRYLINIWLSY